MGQRIKNGTFQGFGLVLTGTGFWFSGREFQFSIKGYSFQVADQFSSDRVFVSRGCKTYVFCRGGSGVFRGTMLSFRVQM